MNQLDINKLTTEVYTMLWVNIWYMNHFFCIDFFIWCRIGRLGNQREYLGVEVYYSVNTLVAILSTELDGDLQKFCEVQKCSFTTIHF